MVITLIILAWLGLCAGSFVNALVWRIKNNKDFVKSRSQCVHCGHELAAIDLIPVLSWLLLRGRCRYCGKPISQQYPIVELIAAVTFVVSFIFWPGGVYGAGDWVLFVTWLLTSIGLLALLIYDLKWMLLPNKILYPTLLVATAGRLIYIASFDARFLHALLQWVLSVLVASGIFWAIFMFSNGRWIGYGDVRLGLITGTVLADPQKAVLMIFLASLLGTILTLPALLRGRKAITTRIPFGPFLIAATGLTLLFGSDLIERYRRLISP
ncbi:MAG TPA: prepilin peptidase [Candidatus Saccharimonadales bacterium]|nr:prepilin peptidase [Candidatus Saccharimonadales bacterium]